MFSNWEMVSRGTLKRGHKASSILKAWAVLAVAQGRDGQTVHAPRASSCYSGNGGGWGLQPGLPRESKFRKVVRNKSRATGTGMRLLRSCPYCQ